MDDFDLRDLLSPPMRHQTDLPASPAPNETHTTIDRSQPATDHVLAMAYVPTQEWQDLYEPEEGLPRGTIFRQLDLPFEGGAMR